MKKTIYILEPFVLYIIAHDAIQFLLYMGLVNRILLQEKIVNGLLNHNMSYITAGVQITSMLFGMMVLMIFNKYTGKKRELMSDPRRYCIQTAMVVLQMLLFAFSLNAIMLNSGFSKLAGTFAKISESQSGVPVVMGVILFGIVSPVVEEYVFRGLIYVRLREVFPVHLAICISAFFFGVYHKNLIQGVYGTLMGLFLTYVYELYERQDLPMPLFTVILCHAVANLFIYFSGRYGLIEKVSVYAGVILLLLGLALVWYDIKNRWRAGGD